MLAASAGDLASVAALVEAPDVHARGRKGREGSAAVCLVFVMAGLLDGDDGKLQLHETHQSPTPHTQHVVANSLGGPVRLLVQYCAIISFKLSRFYMSSGRGIPDPEEWAWATCDGTQLFQRLRRLSQPVFMHVN